MKKQNRKIFASILFLLTSFVCVAVGPLPPPPGPPPPPGLPIDGFLIYGVAIALIFGARKMLLLNKKS